MATKYPKMYDGMYLSDKDFTTAEAILQVRQAKVVEQLREKIFDFPPQLILRSIEEEKSIRDILKEEEADPEPYYGKLRDYQTTGLAFMLLSKRSILADSVGIGKTAEVAGLINVLRERGEANRFLMAVETSAIGQTCSEMMRFTGLRVVSMPSESPKIKKMIQTTDWNKVDGVVIKHSTLRSNMFNLWLAKYMTPEGRSRIFDVFLFDESSFVKNRDTVTYNYASNICNMIPRVHFMNATTFETNIMDIFNQMDMLDPNAMHTDSYIKSHYCVWNRDKYWTRQKGGQAKLNYRWSMVGYKEQEKFKSALKLMYFGRHKSEVGLDRPHIYKVYEIEPTIDQCLAIEKGFRYSEVLNSPSTIPNLGIDTTRKNVPKLDRLCTLIQEEFTDDKVMVYCFNKEGQHAISRELKLIGRNPVIVNGEDTDDEERASKIFEFNKGQCDVFITNIVKSVNLYSGDVCIFYSNLGNPSRMEQARGRIDRNIDDKIKTFIIMLYKGTDEYRFFTETAKERARSGRELTIDAKTAVDFFMESMEKERYS